MPPHSNNLFKTIIIQRQPVIIYEKLNQNIYLIGTNHVSKQSVKAIKELIAFADPDIVAIELCLERLQNANILGNRRLYEKKYQDLLRIPMRLRRKAVAEITRLFVAHQALHADLENPSSHRATRHFKVKPIDIDGLTIAGDVFTPFRDYMWTLESNSKICLSCREAGYKIVLADIPISETCSELATVFSDQEKEIVRKYKEDFVDVFTSNRNGLMGKIWHQNDRIRHIMVERRNEYLSKAILNATQFVKKSDKSQLDVIAIVGRRHVDGILEMWRGRKNS